MPTVEISMVTWNSAEVIPISLGAVFRQDFSHLKVTIVDNASTDGTLAFLASTYPHIQIIRNSQNEGFARAHNQVIRQSTADYILVLNPDVYLQANYVSKVVQVLEDNPEAGAAVGKVFAVEDKAFLQQNFADVNILDGAGLVVFKNRRLYLRGHALPDQEKYNQIEEVFGADGANPLYRRSMLEDICILQEYFDEDFFAYKEDHDLAWRSRLLGWKTMYTPEAWAYHVRHARPGQRVRMRKEVRQLGVRNRYLMMIKNESLALLLLHLPQIIFYELKIAGYIALFERDSLQGYIQAIKLVHTMREKRSQIMLRRKASDRDLLKWFI